MRLPTPMRPKTANVERRDDILPPALKRVWVCKWLFVIRNDLAPARRGVQFREG